MIRLEPLVFDTFGWLFGVREFLREVERALPEAERREEQLLRELGDNLDWDESDYSAAFSEIDAKFHHWVPRVVAYSLVTILQMVVETQLIAAADRERAVRQASLKINQLRGDVLERSRIYFSEAAGLNLASFSEWQSLNDIKALRDVIVHRRGQLGHNASGQKALHSIAARYPGGLSIRGTNPEAEIDLSLDQCHSFLASVEAFFENLFEALGLPRGVHIRH